MIVPVYNRRDEVEDLLLTSFERHYGRMASVAVADSGYGSEKNYRFMEENGIQAYVKYN